MALAIMGPLGRVLRASSLTNVGADGAVREAAAGGRRWRTNPAGASARDRVY